MFAVISPAKKLDLSPIPPARSKGLRWTQPALGNQTRTLANLSRKLSIKDLQQLMKLSVSLAELNHTRFRQFSNTFTAENSKPAVLTFNGDTYRGFDAQSLTNTQLKIAQSRIGILSGLYGLLRPLDLMQPYRLEMGTKLKTPKGNNLYQFWGNQIAEEINKKLAALKSPSLINLASTEYFKAVPRTAIQGTVITPVFKEIKANNPPKVIGLYAKRARGMMARFIIEEKLTKPNGLKAFASDGYAFSKKESSEIEWVFTRKI